MLHNLFGKSLFNILSFVTIIHSVKKTIPITIVTPYILVKISSAICFCDFY